MDGEHLVIMLVIFWVPVMVASTFLGGLVAGCKGRHAVEGVIAGLLLGAVGLLIELLLPEHTPSTAPVAQAPRPTPQT